MARISKLQRRAIAVLFLSGFDPRDLARLFKVTKVDVEAELRRALKRRR